MKLALIGVGQAGGKVVEALVGYEHERNVDFITGALAINTAKADLLGLRYVPEENRILVGQARVKGHGVGADNELGTEVMQEDVNEVMSAIDRVGTHEVDAFLIVAGMGGGTGSGGAPVLAREIKRIYTEPVYGMGILPGTDEGGIYTLNAARSFQTFVREVDNLIVFDNDAWRQAGESVQGGYGYINDEIARRLGMLFSAGETDGSYVAESVVDASEVINTLATGGVSTIGYARTELGRDRGGGLLSRFGGKPERRGDEGDSMNRVTSLVRKATMGRLTLPCRTDSVDRALVVVAGPPETLSRRGIEHGRKWLEDQTGTMEIRGGDYPIPRSNEVEAVVLLSGIYDVPRIKKLQQVAIETQRTYEERDEETAEAFEALIATNSDDEDDDRLQPLF
jgi:cell division GTPase FtsZ